MVATFHSPGQQKNGCSGGNGGSGGGSGCGSGSGIMVLPSKPLCITTSRHGAIRAGVCCHFKWTIQTYPGFCLQDLHSIDSYFVFVTSVSIWNPACVARAYQDLVDPCGLD